MKPMKIMAGALALALAGAAVPMLTATPALPSRGASVNTHTPATWVLSTVGVILVVHSIVLLGYAKEHKTPAPDSR